MGGSLVYVSKYVDPGHPDQDKPAEEVAEKYLALARRMFPDLADEDILDSSLQRARITEPVHLLGGEKRLPDMLPAPGLSLASTAHVYPEIVSGQAVIGVADKVGSESSRGSARNGGRRHDRGHGRRRHTGVAPAARGPRRGRNRRRRPRDALRGARGGDVGNLGRPRQRHRLRRGRREPRRAGPASYVDFVYYYGPLAALLAGLATLLGGAGVTSVMALGLCSRAGSFSPMRPRARSSGRSARSSQPR